MTVRVVAFHIIIAVVYWLLGLLVMMNRLTVGVALLAAGVSASPSRELRGGCPDLASLRTDYVVNSYDENKIAGFWYEIAYQDIAQIGETCQCFNETIDASRGGVGEKFGFTIKNPSSIPLFFEHTDVNGVYMKYMDKSFASNSKLPTVVLDVTLNDDGSYATLTEYTCLDLGVYLYEEIKIGSRTSSVSSATMKALEQTVRDAGIKFDSLNYVNHENCVYNV